MSYKSLPLRKCGLKLGILHLCLRLLCHFPCGSVDWNTWNKWTRSSHYRHFPCGSVDWNVMLISQHISIAMSLPLRKCGLKPLIKVIWKDRDLGHFPCGSVDWNFLLAALVLKLDRHFPCGSVDWNRLIGRFNDLQFSHFPCGSVDWNRYVSIALCILCSHFPCGSVDWNTIIKHNTVINTVTSLAEVWIETCAVKTYSWTDSSHFPCGSVDWNKSVNL